MSKKSIVSVNCIVPGDLSEFVAFDSRTSLLDADIVLFCPTLADFGQQYREICEGKPMLSNHSSFELREAANHWRREIRNAMEAGKTVFVFLQELEEVFVVSKVEEKVSGRTKIHNTYVEKFDSLRSLPFEMEAVPSQGQAMKLTDSGTSLLSDYWREFQDDTSYHVHLGSRLGKPLVVTKHGGRVVGTLLRSKELPGSVVVLPFLEIWDQAFAEEVDTDDGIEVVPTTEGKSFGRRLTHCLLQIDQALRSEMDVTPAPVWALEDQYGLSDEAVLRAQIVDIEAELSALTKKRDELTRDLKKAGSSRRLLYEKGKPLEESIVEALRLLGFTATPYRDSESEFDVVFDAPEGRFIGEVEGKDNKPINIDKLRQLESNIHEDFARADVSEMAKGVLFGNAYRLSEPGDRAEYFTDKCISAARRNGTALVRTPDLFRVYQYLSRTDDDTFRSECRSAILSAEGDVVQFPEAPGPSTVEVSSDVAAAG